MHPSERKNRDDMEKAYYDQAEKAVRNMSKYDYPGQSNPFAKKDSCVDKFFQLALLAITFSSLFS